MKMAMEGKFDFVLKYITARTYLYGELCLRGEYCPLKALRTNQPPLLVGWIIKSPDTIFHNMLFICNDLDEKTHH
jgi:hypothetical protein